MQLPWSDCENQFQIMYQLGTGNHPSVPRDALSEEGRDFLSHCFAQDPAVRWNASKLLNHHFVKVRCGDLEGGSIGIDH